MRYVEPYAGGASVALSLLFEGYVEKVLINDMNLGVYFFWKFLLEDEKSLCDRIMSTEVTVDEWRNQKKTYSDPSSSPEDLAFATFFLNRTNRSGIVSGGGVIGGLSQEGKWKIDARYNKDALCKRIKKVNSFRESIEVCNQDALSLIRGLDQEEGNSFLYLDPPYYVKGSQLYDNFYLHDDHLEISIALRNIGLPWVISYDAAPEILDMYSFVRGIRYELSYSASKRSTGSEVMFFSPSIKIDGDMSPTQVSRSHLQG